MVEHEATSGGASSEALFIDGQVNTPKCRCTADCEMPCWQLVGLTDSPCGGCGCGTDALDVVPAVIQVRPGDPIPDGYVPVKTTSKMDAGT